MVNHHARDLLSFYDIFSVRVVVEDMEEDKGVQSGIRGWVTIPPLTKKKLELCGEVFLLLKTGNSVIPVKNLFPALTEFSMNPIGGPEKLVINRRRASGSQLITFHSPRKKKKVGK